jgi:hypothetical protein
MFAMTHTISGGSIEFLSGGDDIEDWKVDNGGVLGASTFPSRQEDGERRELPSRKRILVNFRDSFGALEHISQPSWDHKLIINSRQNSKEH